MSLAPGHRLGPYEVIAAIGAGGMGEVYRATDSRLKRDVAIKVLPASMSADPDRLARFQREAEVLAALNHPHIASIYGLEEVSSTSGHAPARALVMELVEGPTLADRIAQGALPLDDALAIARQIADALQAAHERGIVHRDLKPANVKVRPDGTVKVLDFGLAKALGRDGATSNSGDIANSPTITSPAMTQAGMILGTAAYMAPEQARGRTADKRADIWAFGCVLFEMLTRKRAFPGEDVTDTLAAVVKSDPEWRALGTDIPPRVRQALRACLQKDPRQRVGDIAAIRLALDGAFEADAPPAASAPMSSRRAIWPAAAAALVTGGVIAGAAAWMLRPAPATLAVSRFTIDQVDGVPIQAPVGQVTTMALSPDGTKIAYRIAASQTNKIPRFVVRHLDALDGIQIYEGTGSTPFFSPDSQWLGFFATEGGKGTIKKIAVTGGPALTISVINPSTPHGAVWGDDDTIVFALHDQGLWRVPAAGGQAEPIASLTRLAPDGKAPPTDHREWPALLPGGRGLLYSERLDPRPGAEASRIVLKDLESGEERVLVTGGTFPQYAEGHLVYAYDGTLRAVGFDPDRREVIGVPRPVIEGVVTRPEGAAEFRISRGGSLVYMSGSPAGRSATLVWRDRSGRETPFDSNVLSQPQHPRLSPDGRRLALVVANDLWVYFLDGRPPIRLGSGNVFLSPLWSPDGQRLIYESGGGLLSVAADGGDTTPVAASVPGHFHPHGWAGSDLLAVRIESTGDIVRWPIAKPAEISPVVATPAGEGGLGAAFSPDGRWLAYASNQTGTWEVWARPYPGLGAPIRLSPNGGRDLVWSKNGRELYYLSQGRLMAVPVGDGPTPFGSPALLFEVTPFRVENQPPAFDVTADGRFIFLKAQDSGKTENPNRLVVVLNWSQELLRTGASALR